jgi:hypothetical protein
MMRRNLRQLQVLLTLVTLLVWAPGCDPADDFTPRGEFLYATASNDCGPADGPAVSINLTQRADTAMAPAPPALTFYIWENATSISRRRIEVGSSSVQGSARLCPVGGECVIDDSGFVRFGRAAWGDVVEGEYDVHFADGTRRTGAFQAAWQERRILCG